VFGHLKTMELQGNTKFLLLACRVYLASGALDIHSKDTHLVTTMDSVAGTRPSLPLPINQHAWKLRWALQSLHAKWKGTSSLSSKGQTDHVSKGDSARYTIHPAVLDGSMQVSLKSSQPLQYTRSH
jgi:hypothetical protein